MLISFGSSEFPVGSVHLSGTFVTYMMRRSGVARARVRDTHCYQPTRGLHQVSPMRVIPNWSAAKLGSCGGKLSSRERLDGSPANQRLCLFTNDQ